MMRCRTLIPAIVGMVLATGLPVRAQSVSELLEKGIFTEETVGDLDAAIKIYENIAANAEANRKYAAQARYRLGMCYLKKGKKDEAVAALRRLVRDFPNQKDLVARAYTRLAALGYRASRAVVRRVWEGPDVDIRGAPSPDGRNLSYVDRQTGDLAIRDLTTGKNRRLTKKVSRESIEGAGYSIISHDGKQVAYAWFNEDFSCDLRIVGVDGSEPRVVLQNDQLENIAPREWSPDGKHILATFLRRDGSNQIVLIAVADGALRVLKTLTGRIPRQIRSSPDWRYIAYDFLSKEGSQERDIFLLSTDGTREVRLVTHAANDLRPIWTPDGKGVLFLSDRAGSMGLWFISVLDGKPQGSPELVRANTGAIIPMGLLRNGSFYYGLWTRMQDVYVATLDLMSGKVIAAPTPATQYFVGHNTSPEWSPDGKYLAYISQRGRVHFGLRSWVIVIRSVETGEEREISPKLELADYDLRWSPDGRSVLVAARDEKGRQGFYQVNTQTGDVSAIVQRDPGEGYIEEHVWSADGKALFYDRHETPITACHITVRDLDTGREKELYRAVQPAENVGTLAISPDGRQLAFQLWVRATRLSTVKVMPAGGGEPRELVEFREPEFISAIFGLAWTPDGRQLLFGKGRDDPQQEHPVELWRIPAEGGKPKKLGLAMEGMRDLSVHPDGQCVAFTAGRNKAEVWVMENFLPEPTAAP